jgi:sigma-B regulation protein RsbU (phosphoserine phosphatase)
MEVFPMTCNIVLGILDGFNFTSHSIPFREGDVLVLYTDGVTEAFNSNQEEYGFETLQELLREKVLNDPEVMTAGNTTEITCRTITGDVTRFAGDEEQSDDITVLVVKRT